MKNLRTFILYIIAILPAFTVAQDVRVEAALDTSKLRIGEQVHLDLYLSYDAREKDLAIRWPAIADTLARKVEVIAVGNIDTTLPRQSNSPRIFQHQRITLSVYDSGYYYIPPLRFIINNDSARSLYTRPLMLEVHTVPTDTSLSKIKDIKPPLLEPFNWRWYMKYVYWTLGALAILALIIFLIIYFSKRRKRPEPEPEKPKIPAHIIALQQLEQIKQEQVWREGKIKAYYSSISDAVRLYIENRFGLNALESTTEEIMTSFRSQVVDEESKQKLRQMLTLSDLVKFAKMTPVENEHDITLKHAYDFVNGTKREETVINPSAEDQEKK